MGKNQSKKRVVPRVTSLFWRWIRVSEAVGHRKKFNSSIGPVREKGQGRIYNAEGAAAIDVDYVKGRRSAANLGTEYERGDQYRLR